MGFNSGFKVLSKQLKNYLKQTKAVVYSYIFTNIRTHYKQGTTRYHNAIIATSDISNFSMH